MCPYLNAAYLYSSFQQQISKTKTIKEENLLKEIKFKKVNYKLFITKTLEDNQQNDCYTCVEV